MQGDVCSGQRNEHPVHRREKDGRKFHQVGQQNDFGGRRRYPPAQQQDTSVRRSDTSVRRGSTSVRVAGAVVVVIRAHKCPNVPFCRRFPLKFSGADHFCFTAREWALLLKTKCYEH